MVQRLYLIQLFFLFFPASLIIHTFLSRLRSLRRLDAQHHSVVCVHSIEHHAIAAERHRPVRPELPRRRHLPAGRDANVGPFHGDAGGVGRASVEHGNRRRPCSPSLDQTSPECTPISTNQRDNDHAVWRRRWRARASPGRARKCGISRLPYPVPARGRTAGATGSAASRAGPAVQARPGSPPRADGGLE